MYLKESAINYILQSKTIYRQKLKPKYAGFKEIA